MVRVADGRLFNSSPFWEEHRLRNSLFLLSRGDSCVVSGEYGECLFYILIYGN